MYIHYLDHDQNGNSGWRSNYDDQNDLYSEPWNDQVDQNDQFRSNNDQVDQNDQFRSNYDQVDQNDPWDDHFGTSDQNDRYDQVPDEEDFSDEFDEKTEEFSEKRYNVINELISTEKDYLECLAIVRDYFIVPLKQNGILAEDEMEIIFINWNDLWLCTNRLYKSLKIRRKMTIKKDINIGDILCENVSIKFVKSKKCTGVAFSRLFLKSIFMRIFSFFNFQFPIWSCNFYNFSIFFIIYFLISLNFLS